jgi:hypothetical protein
MTVIPVLRKLRQEDGEFQAILGYIEVPLQSGQRSKTLSAKDE